MGMLMILVVIHISESICVSKYHIVNLKYIQFLIAKYTSVKLGKSKEGWREWL